jgi:hypothetical protein
MQLQLSYKMVKALYSTRNNTYRKILDGPRTGKGGLVGLGQEGAVSALADWWALDRKGRLVRWRTGGNFGFRESKIMSF